MQEKKVVNKGFDIKRIILLTFTFMTVGILFELYLLEHFEDSLQLIPIILIAIAMALFIVLQFKQTRVFFSIFKLSLIAISLSGFYGVFLHLSGNFEFEQEMRPTAHSWDLFIESLSGAFPALAPLNLIILSLIGYTYLKLINQKK